MLAVCGNVAAAVETHFQIHQQPALYRPGKAHRKQHKIRLELEFSPRHPREVRATIGEHLPLQTDGMDPLHSAIRARERGGSDAPLAIASFLVRV